MDYSLFIDLEAMAVLHFLPAKVRRRLLTHLVQMRLSPEALSNDHERDRIGRRAEISFVVGYAIHYWIDSPDRHIKVLKIRMVEG